MSTPIVCLSKKITFSAAHRLYSTQLSDEENLKLFGKCTRRHGHNYTVKVMLRGSIDPKLGYFINATTLKKLMLETIDKVLDHRSIDDDIPYFKERVSTMENLAVFIWESMKSAMEKPELLNEVKIKETDTSAVTYRGESS